MARFKNHLLVVIGFAFAGLIGAAFGTGTAQAVVSTLVSVVNPSTSPVPTSTVNVTDPGRIAYRSQLNSVGDVQPCSSVVPCCQLTFPAVPAGHRLVIEQVNVIPSFTKAPQSPIVNLNQQINGNGFGPVLTYVPPVSSLQVQAYLFPVVEYLEPGSEMAVFACDTTGSATINQMTVILTGYELDCAAAACSPIATQ